MIFMECEWRENDWQTAFSRARFSNFFRIILLQQVNNTTNSSLAAMKFRVLIAVRFCIFIHAFLHSFLHFHYILGPLGYPFHYILGPFSLHSGPLGSPKETPGASWEPLGSQGRFLASCRGSLASHRAPEHHFYISFLMIFWKMSVSPAREPHF